MAAFRVMFARGKHCTLARGTRDARIFVFVFWNGGGD